MALPAVVQAQFLYRIDNGTITITRYTGPGGAVAIPDIIDALPVTRIGAGAFSSSSSLTSVTIPNSITIIEPNAFSACNNLTTILIPSSVTNIGSSAFANCTSLTSITVDAANLLYSSADGVLFNKPQTLLFQCPGGKAGSYTSPDSVTNMLLGAFRSCASLTSITLSSNLTAIGNFMFQSCTSLTAITIPSGVSSIGISAFMSCLNLTNVDIPQTVTSIANSAFYSCSNLTGITIPNSVTAIGQSAFAICTHLAIVTIPDSVTNIGAFAFYNCTGLNSVTIADGVASIESYAFYACRRLTNVTIPSSVTGIGIGVFYACTSLSAITVDPLNSAYSSVDGVLFNKTQTLLVQFPPGKAGSCTIPTGVGSIGDRAFDSCGNLTAVTVPNSVTNIGNEVFHYCPILSAITVDPLNSVYSSVDGVLFNKSQTVLIQCPGGKAGSYTIPSSVARIGSSAFHYCRNLDSIIIPESVTTIEDRAFYTCDSLFSVTLPSSVTSIGEFAFQYCTNLTSVTIPNSITNIGDGAFYSCNRLTGVYFQGNAPSAGQNVNVFSLAYNVTVYYLPGTTGWGPTFAGRPAVLWNPLVATSDGSFGVRTNRFGFTITGASNLVLVVEASTNLVNPTWIPVGTNTLTGGSFYFSDPEWTNHPAHFYRLRSP